MSKITDAQADLIKTIAGLNHDIAHSLSVYQEERAERQTAALEMAIKSLGVIRGSEPSALEMLQRALVAAEEQAELYAPNTSEFDPIIESIKALIKEAKA